VAPYNTKPLDPSTNPTARQTRASNRLTAHCDRKRVSTMDRNANNLPVLVLDWSMRRRRTLWLVRLELWLIWNATQ